MNDRVPLTRFNSPLQYSEVPVIGLRSLPQLIRESVAVDCTVPHIGFRTHAQWILESPSWISESFSVDSRIPLSGFCSPLRGIAQSLITVDYAAPPPPSHPLWRIAQSPLVDAADLTVKTRGGILYWVFRIPWRALWIIHYYILLF